MLVAILVRGQVALHDELLYHKGQLSVLLVMIGTN